MSWIKIKVVAFFLLTIVSLFALEVISLSAYALHHLAFGGKSAIEFKEIMLNHYSKIYSVRSSMFGGDFDPVTQMQFPASFKASDEFTTNEYGFLSNGSVEPLANQFPDKNSNLYRVVMLGGSSMFGSGVDSNKKTISAHLERIINSKGGLGMTSRKYIQVLNFGHPGAHSSIELAKLTQYLIHLEPDLVISLDGFNDAWYALFEHNRQVGDFQHGVINWADYSYLYYDVFSGGSEALSGASFGPLSYILPTTSSFTASLYNKLFPGDLFTKIKDYPPFKVSSFINSRDGGFANALLVNYSAMGGLACAQGVSFYGILQPHALENYPNLTVSEKEKISIWESEYGLFTGGKDGYSSEMSNLYDRYEDGLAELNAKFSNCPNVEFLSFRDLFDKPHTTDLFVDIIHYTEQGNKQLALEMVPLIKAQILK